MTESNVLDNPNDTVNVMWLSATETTNEDFGCFMAVGSGTVSKKRFPLEDNDLTISEAGDSNTSEVVYI